MKKNVFLVIAILASFSLSAQKYGLKGGLNLATMYGADVDGAKSKVGFQLGALYEHPLSEGLYLQPEAVISLKGAKDVNAYYLEIPVRLLYKLGAGSGKVALAAGPYLGLGLFGKSDGENTFGKDAQKRFDAGVSGAVGYELPNGVFVNFESSLGLLKLYKDWKAHNSILALTAGVKF